jgi:DNA mismatch repair protein MutL
MIPYAQQVDLICTDDPLSIDGEVLSCPWKFIGILRSIYVLLESSNGLMILHYRAAQERIFFEKRLAQKGHMASLQELLIPIVIPAIDDNDKNRRCLQLLQDHGWECHCNARKECIITAVPSCLDPDKAAIYLQCLWSSEDNLQHPDIYAHTLCRYYPHPSLLESNSSQIKEIVSALLSCQQPLMTPNGQPIYYEIPFRDIENRL